MKILSINSGNISSGTHSTTVSNLYDSTPFGHDLLIVNASNITSMYGQGNHAPINSRWSDAVKKWSNGNRKIIIFTDELTYQALNWLPLTQESRIALTSLHGVGNSNYLGNITSTDPIIRHFLEDNKQFFTINTYLKHENASANISIHCGVDETLITSFTYKDDLIEVLFLPLIAVSSIESLINTFDTPANAWSIEGADALNKKISEIDRDMNNLYIQRDKLYEELSALNKSISDTINFDLYLTRAIGHFNSTISTEHPSPESYYAAIEAIENAFTSEREMRDSLGLSKAYIDKVMRRANEFRHEAKDGSTPNPLTADEIIDLNDRVNTVISAYIKYLMKKS